MDPEENFEIEIIYEDDNLIAINKPHGLLVHRSRIANDAKVFALQLLRDKIGQRVYPTHRLDRKTSGVLLFAKDTDSNAAVQQLFRDRKISKNYLAIVRGHMDQEGKIDYPLSEGNGPAKEAQTTYKVLESFELDIPSGKFPTSRYSLLELTPNTGRFHQIRKHLAHVFHPIIGDRPHGCNKQNKIWLDTFNLDKMLLHASRLHFEWSVSQHIDIKAAPSTEFTKSLQILRSGEAE